MCCHTIIMVSGNGISTITSTGERLNTLMVRIDHLLHYERFSSTNRDIAEQAMERCDAAIDIRDHIHTNVNGTCTHEYGDGHPMYTSASA